jgi:hypothetical protein
MKWRAGSALAVLFLLPAVSSAHRLDEYLQAARVAVTRNRIAIEFHLTPGVSVAADIIALIDRDGTGSITSREASAYGKTVLAETVLVVDGRAVPLALTEVHVPEIAAMRAGMGAIRIDASAAVAIRTTGPHHLSLRNNHRPDVSVYLVNALIPDMRAVVIVGQRRDVRQREFHLEYLVSDHASAIAWSMGALLVIAALAVSRKRMNEARRSAG